jgi:hypothetical protein
MGSPAWQLTEIELPFEVASMDPKPSGDALADDAGILVYPQAGVDAQPLFVSSAEVRFLALDLASTLMNLIPGFGQIKGVVEGALGKDLVSGRNLAGWERALNLASVVPHLHGHSIMTKAVGEIGHLAHQANTAVHANHAMGIYGGSGSGQGGSQQAPAPGGGDPLQTGTGRLP